MNHKSIFTVVSLLGATAMGSVNASEPPPLTKVLRIVQDPTGRQLQSAFIWTHNPPTGDKEGVAVAFRKSFDLERKPTGASLQLFADARYVLWVNGTYVERGPARFQPNGPEYDSVEIAPWLHAGKNSIALLCVGNLSGGKVMMHQPGLTASLQSGGLTLWTTDESWRWTDATRYRAVAASWPNLGETLVDATVEDGDWTLPGYDDAKWKSAVRISGSAWGPLTARRIPLLKETVVPVHFANAVELPVTLTAGQKLEFTTGRIVQAYPLVQLDAEAGTEIKIEPYDVTYLAKPGSQSHFTLDTRGISNGALVVTKGRATITGFKLVERLYPYTCLGAFTCNDPFLNRLWEMCARSCEVLSEDSYVDCADRERVEWMDDTPPGFDITRTVMAGPAGANGRPVFGDPRLMEEMVRRTALTLQPEGWVKAHTCSDRYDIHAKMEDRACDWVEGIRLYYEATGNTKVVREIWPAVVAQMDYFLNRRGDQGLVSARDWVVWGNPLGYLTGQTTTLNVFVQKALADSAFLAGVIGEKTDSARFAREADQLYKGINRVLWDEESGSYYSGYFSEKEAADNAKAQRYGPVADLPRTHGFTPPTLHANVFALDRGVVPPGRRDRVLSAMIKQTPERISGSVMIYYYVMKQIYNLDTPELDTRVLDMFRQGWKPMVAFPWQCSWEDMSGLSHAHIYGMYPGYFLSAYVLGVHRDAPASERQLLIEPRLGDLSDLKGVVVTEFGPVQVEWKRQDGELTFLIDMPENTRGILRLPDGDADSLVLDGGRVASKIQGRYVTVAIGPGKHTGWLQVKPAPVASCHSGITERRISEKSAAVGVIARTTDESPAGLEADLVKSGLVDIDSIGEAGVAAGGEGGGANADALHNGTTQNGSGGTETLNDGRTFRGYGNGHSLSFQFTRPHEIKQIRTFAGHPDERASQSYDVLVAYDREPTKFVKVADAAVNFQGGASELIVNAALKNVLSVRFDFHDGPVGFNAYREIQVIGNPSANR